MSTPVNSKPKRTYQIWLEQSVISSHIGAYRSYLSEHGYAANTVGLYLHSVAHFSSWLKKNRVPIHRINEALVQQFITVHPPARVLDDVSTLLSRCGLRLDIYFGFYARVVVSRRVLGQWQVRCKKNLIALIPTFIRSAGWHPKLAPIDFTTLESFYPAYSNRVPLI
jgi:hypothetical protein